MSVFQGVIKDLQGLYPDLKLDESGKSASKPVTTALDLVLYEEKTPAEFGGMYDKAEVDTGMIDAEYMEVEA